MIPAFENDIVKEKKQLRKELKSFEKGDSEKAQSLFLNSGLYKNASFIMIFISAGNEIDTARIIEKCLSDGKRIAVPRCGKKPGCMDFHFLKNEPVSSQTEKGAYGITEPLKTLKKVRAFFVPENTIMVVPGLGFSRDGKRIGHGKGFYDRYISRLLKFSPHFKKSGILTGFAFSSQIAENIPVEENDIPMNFIVTDKEIIDCSKN